MKRPAAEPGRAFLPTETIAPQRMSPIDPLPFNAAAFDTALAELRRHAGAGSYAFAARQLEALLATAPAPEASRRGQALALLAHIHPRLGRLPASVRCATEAVALAERLGDHGLLADGLTALSFAYGQLLMGRDALDAGLRALAAARRLADPLREAWALNRVGIAHAGLEHPAQACATTEQALELARLAGAAEVEFSCQNNLAYFWMRRLDDARGLREPIALAEAMRQACASAEQACELARQSGSPYKIALALSNLVDAHLAGGRTDEVLPLLNEFGRLAHEHAYPSLVLEADAQRAVYLRLTGQPEQAAAMLLSLLDARHGATPTLRRLLIAALYQTEKACDRPAQALHWLEELMHHERRIRRDTLAVQSEVLLIREQIEAASARADSARADADRERARVVHLEGEQRQLREHARALDRAAHEDVLTGLHNRRHAEFALPLLLEGARQAGVPISLALLDVDHFKRINDGHGHATGDAVLAQLGQLLRQRLRGADLLARVGGEEFMAVLVGSSPAQAAEVCERLRVAVQAHPWGEIAPGLAVTLSGGLAGGEPPEQEATLLASADQALYAAKRGGRNQIQISP
jgi:diguanylate cyclase (GGDEF)-like protein